MPISRRAVLAAAAALAAPRPVRAQGAGEWPTGRPIRIIVPFAAGGSSDAVGRFLAERLQRNLGQPVVVENRAGMAGTMGVEQVARSPADGTAYVIITTNHAINETLQPRRGYDMLRDLAPVAAINALPLAFAVANGVPARTIAEFVAHAKANPGKLDYATSGPGSLYHLLTEQFSRATGIEMQHIPYRNFNEGRTALIAGQVHAMFDAAFTLAPLIQAGQMRGLATTGPTRMPMLPDLPLLSETVPGLEATLWNGLLGPAGLPGPIVARMNAELNRVLADPATIEAQARIGALVTPMPVDAFAAFLRREIERQGAAVREAGVKLD